MDSAPVGPASHQVGGYCEFPPPPDLADAVEALWIHQAPERHVLAHRVVPDAAVSLSFMGSSAPEALDGGARLRVIGPVSRPHTFAPPPGHRMASIRIKLEWCRRLLGVVPSEHVDHEPRYADVRPDLAVPLEGRLARSAGSMDVLHVLLDFVRARRAASYRRTTTLLIAGMESLRHGPGQPRVAEVATRLGVTDRHFRRLALDETGFSPRHFARIQRFHALLRSADRTSRPEWAALAFRHGYADQSHLIREVQDFAGVPPTRLLAERRAEQSATG
jgi:AraC-like DNA-binding protein